MTAFRPRARAASVWLVSLAAAVLVLTACAPVKKRPLVLMTFECTNAAQTFVVPAGITQIGVVAEGAQGGAGGGMPGTPGAGGLGGQATATVPVTPGETLEVNVGCQGGDPTMASAGGFNGGGEGGDGFVPADDGGGGGGASDVRRGAERPPGGGQRRVRWR